MFHTTWAGDCSAWECDELGHLKMSYYFDKFEQARAGLFIRLGLIDAFKADAMSTVRARDIHIKYLAEARPGTPLRIESALLGLDTGSARVGHVMYHLDGRIAATLTETVEHVYLRTYKLFTWPTRMTDMAEAHMAQMPAPARPRNITLDWDMPAPSAQELQEAGAASIGGGLFRSDDIVPAGHVPISRIMRRITTTLGWFQDGWPEFSDPDYVESGGSAVVLEIRMRQHRYAEIGTAYDLRPAVVDANEYTRTIMHNVLDVVSGASLASGYAAGALFNLNTRKLTKLTPDQLADLQSRAIASLRAPSS